jgi:hypothetical protein
VDRDHGVVIARFGSTDGGVDWPAVLEDVARRAAA